jgi:hypothetical protein
VHLVTPQPSTDLLISKPSRTTRLGKSRTAKEADKQVPQARSVLTNYLKTLTIG